MFIKNVLSLVKIPKLYHHISNRMTSYDASFVAKLKEMLGNDNVSTSNSILQQHGKDEGHFESHPPDVVVWPLSTEQISDVTKMCYNSNIPIIPFGTGTGLEGGVNALSGGVCIDLSKMNRILEVNAEDFDCVVESGVTWRDLNNYLRDTGLWFPIDPGASASLGGMTATGASGTNAVQYGTMKQNILNLEVVLPSGEIIHTSGIKTRSRKSSAGYNLTGLFIGSEGTLGIITKIFLKLHAIPDSVGIGVCSFPSDRSAVDSVIQTLQSNISIARIEFLDRVSMAACRAFSKVTFPEAPTIFYEFNGSNTEEIQQKANAVKLIAESNDGSNFELATDLESRNKLWKARYELSYAIIALQPNSKDFTTDVCVPISKLTEMIVHAQADIKKSGLIGTSFGHVGDGNFHSVIMFDNDNPEECKRVNLIALRMGEYALSLGGTCTGEHGIGRGKMQLLQKQYDSDTIDAMKRIKTVFDPKSLMNPGKLF